MSPRTQRQLRGAAFVFTTLGICAWVAASVPDAVDQRLEQLRTTAVPNVAALEEREAVEGQKTPAGVLPHSGTQKQAPAEPVRATKAKTSKIEVSCYTGIESKGANGRNSWSVATYRFPRGTRLHIEGFGNKIVETVTAEAYAHRVDVWFGDTQDDHDRCIAFGTRVLAVTVL
jgi:3D (Asp-Asp-Asp) domain-containing protein